MSRLVHISGWESKIVHIADLPEEVGGKVQTRCGRWIDSGAGIEFDRLVSHSGNCYCIRCGSVQDHAAVDEIVSQREDAEKSKRAAADMEWQTNRRKRMAALNAVLDNILLAVGGLGFYQDRRWSGALDNVGILLAIGNKRIEIRVREVS